MSAIFHVVQGSDGLQLPVGSRQAAFLVEEGHIEPLGVSGLYASRYSAQEVHAIVLSYPELRECDFCGATPGGWRIQARPWFLSLPGLKGKMGGPERPIFACPECAALVRANDKRTLAERSAYVRVEQAIEKGLLPRGISPTRARRAVRPALMAYIDEVFAHRIGFPERDE